MERVETSPGTTVLGLFGRHSVKALIDKLCQSHMCHTHTHTNTWTGGGFALSPRCDVLGVWREGCVQNAIIKFFNNPLCPDCISICATFLCENLIFHQLVFRQFDCAAKVLLLLCCHPQHPEKVALCAEVEQSPIANLLIARQFISFRPR